MLLEHTWEKIGNYKGQTLRPFIKMLNNSDIISLSELHTEEKDLFIPGYKLLKHKIRKKEHNKGPKISGGIAVFVKEALLQYITLSVSSVTITGNGYTPVLLILVRPSTQFPETYFYKNSSTLA